MGHPVSSLFHEGLVRKHDFVVQVNTFNTENYKPWDFQNKHLLKIGLCRVPTGLKI